MSTEIQLKSFSAADWTTNQGLLGNVPILVKGEAGYESDTGKFKIGDGTSIWSALAYFQTGAGSSSNSFATIAVPSGTNPAASTSTDTLTFANGTGITITGNSSTDTITIASTITDTNTFPTTWTWTDGTTVGPTASITGTSSAITVAAIPSASASVAGIITTGAQTFSGVKTFTAPVLGAATATTINKVTLTAPATGSTITIADGKTLTASNTLTFSGTDTSTLNIGTGGTLGTAAYTASTAYISSTLMTTLGDTIYGGTSGASTRLAGPATNGTYVLTSVPSASVAVAPAWALASGLTVSSATTATNVIATVTGTNTTELVRGNMADNDQFRILVGGTATNAGYAEIATADDGTEPIYVRQYTGVFATLLRTATLLDGSGNTTLPGDITIQGGDILTNQTTFNLLNTTATTLNIGGAATTMNVGVAGGVVNFAGAVDLRAGGTAVDTAPLYFSASTDLLSIPVAGAVEYNNANFLATPFTTSGRALIQATYFYSNQAAVTIAGTSTGLASISGNAFGVALPLATSTAYQIEATFYLQTSYTVNAPTSESMTFSYPTGTTILAEGSIIQNVAAVNSLSTASSNYAMAENLNRTVTAVTASGNWHRIVMRGIIRTSTNAGSFSVVFGGTNGASPATLTLTLGANSFIKLTPLGSATSSNSFGAWA